MRFRASGTMIVMGLLLGWAQMGPAQKPDLPVLETTQLQRGSTVNVKKKADKVPEPAPRMELTRAQQTVYVPLTFEPPTPPETLGVTSGVIPEGIDFGDWQATFYWGNNRFGLGKITIQPAGNVGVKLTRIAPENTYDVETAYVPDPSDKNSHNIPVTNYSIPIDKSQLPNLRIHWGSEVYDAVLNGCSFVPPLGTKDNPVPAPSRFYALEIKVDKDKPAAIEVCNVPTEATFEMVGTGQALEKTQTGEQSSEMWLAAPKKSIKHRVVSVALYGSGFQVGNPNDNTIWIDGVRQSGVVWDSCSNDLNLGARNAPRSVAIHGEVISSEEMHLCLLPVPAKGSMQLRVGYGDLPSVPKEFRAFNMGRTTVAIWSTGIALTLALLPLFLLSSLQRSYRIAGSDYKWRMLFLDPETDTYSLSKLQFYLWTVVALFGYAYLFISRVKVQYGPWPDVPASLPGVILVAGGTAVTSQIVTSMKGSKGAGEEKPSLADFITSGGVVAADRLQMLLWTLFGVGAFLYSVLQLLPGTIDDLPSIPDRMMVLMGISSAGYLGGKIARKAGPVISEISVTPAESDATLAQKQTVGETPDLLAPLAIAQQVLAGLNAGTNANAKTAVDTLDKAIKSAGAAHTSAEFNQLVVDLAAKCTAAETAAAAAAADFAGEKASGPEAEAAQTAAAALGDFSGDVMQAISLASTAPMAVEEAPQLITRMIELRGNNLSAEALLQIDHADLPFRMLTDKDGNHSPEIVTRDQANPTCASVLRMTIDPSKLGDSDQTQVASWFSTDAHHMLTLINPDGQKSELGFDLPPATAQKVTS